MPGYAEALQSLAEQSRQKDALLGTDEDSRKQVTLPGLRHQLLIAVRHVHRAIELSPPCAHIDLACAMYKGSQ